jgi:hypothetical protein
MDKELVVVQPISPQKIGSLASNKIGRIINQGSREDCRDNINNRDNKLKTARALSTDHFARIATQKI